MEENALPRRDGEDLEVDLCISRNEQKKATREREVTGKWRGTPPNRVRRLSFLFDELRLPPIRSVASAPFGSFARFPTLSRFLPVLSVFPSFPPPFLLLGFLIRGFPTGRAEGGREGRRNKREGRGRERVHRGEKAGEIDISIKFERQTSEKDSEWRGGRRW